LRKSRFSVRILATDRTDGRTDRQTDNRRTDGQTQRIKLLSLSRAAA